MNAFEIFGLLAAGALLVHGLLAACLWLEARLINAPFRDSSAARDEPGARSPAKRSSRDRA